MTKYKYNSRYVGPSLVVFPGAPRIVHAGSLRPVTARIPWPGYLAYGARNTSA